MTLLVAAAFGFIAFLALGSALACAQLRGKSELRRAVFPPRDGVLGLSGQEEQQQ